MRQGRAYSGGMNRRRQRMSESSSRTRSLSFRSRAIGRANIREGSVQVDQGEVQVLAMNLQHAHGVGRRPAALRRATGIEDLKAGLLLVGGEMGVAEHHRLRFREAPPQTPQVALRGPCVVN